MKGLLLLLTLCVLFRAGKSHDNHGDNGGPVDSTLYIHGLLMANKIPLDLIEVSM